MITDLIIDHEIHKTLICSLKACIAGGRLGMIVCIEKRASADGPTITAGRASTTTNPANPNEP
jgi:hypothetical protein